MDGLGLAFGAISLVFWNVIRSAKSHRNIPPELAGSKYSRQLYVAIKCALIAGDNISRAIKGDKKVTSKGGVDFVTETDKANERIIFQFLRRNFPGDNFIGEVVHF
jgi:hypothetical protein